MDAEPAILVTGAPRTGTTILGTLLALPRQVGYVYEPFNVQIGLRDVPRQFLYVTDGGQAEPAATEMVRALLSGRGHFRQSSVAPARNVLHDQLRHRLTSRTQVRYRASALDPRRRRWLLKDPLAAMSSEWLHQRWGMQTVVIVRHPAPTVASYLRLRWRFGLEALTGQSELMQDHLGPLLNGVNPAALSPVQEGALLWRAHYEVLQRYLARNPGMVAVRHEDLANDPLGVTADLYTQFGLPFDDGIAARIKGYTGRDNPTAPVAGQVHTLRRNSRASLEAWQGQLDPSDLAEIRTLTADLADSWYEPSSWSYKNRLTL